MVALKEWFENNRYKAKWEIGDRVYGKYNKIPFIGTVGNDTLVNEDEGPRVSVHLYLPIIEDGIRKTVIFVKPNSLKRTKEYD
jgi:hypothetical protein